MHNISLSLFTFYLIFLYLTYVVVFFFCRQHRVLLFNPAWQCLPFNWSFDHFHLMYLFKSNILLFSTFFFFTVFLVTFCSFLKNSYKTLYLFSCMQYVCWWNPFLAYFKIFLIPWFLTFWLWYALVWFCSYFLGFRFCFCFFSLLDMWFYKTDKNSKHFYDNPFSFFWDFN